MESIDIQQPLSSPPRREIIQPKIKAISRDLPWTNPISCFGSLSLKELGGAALLNRQETKYVFPKERLLTLFSGLESDYSILEIQGRRYFEYQSIYYDLPNRQFFNQHQKGALPRWKIRRRTYLNTGLSYLEVKHKDNRKRTQKSRLLIPFPSNNFSGEDLAFLASCFTGRIADLRATLETRYTRITLVHRNKRERITLDLQLSFSDGLNSRSLSEFAVAEIKQNRIDPSSPFINQLREKGIRPGSFSKYCIGTILLNPEIKHNRFKPILHQLKVLP